MESRYIPTDILEEIVQRVDRPRDLLSLALSSRRLRDIIVPRHLPYRQISCSPHRISLWKSLEKSPHLAAKFRSLELYAEASSIYRAPPIRLPEPRQWPMFPRSLVEGTGDIEDAIASGIEVSVEGLNALKLAVVHMKRLKRFTWKDQRITSDTDDWSAWFSTTAETMLHVRDLFDVITESCPLLKEVDLHFPTGDPYDDSSEDTVSLPLGKFSDLDRFSFTAYASWTRRIRHNVLDLFMGGCPNLVDLKLQVYFGTWDEFDNLTDVLMKGHWPRLRRLTIDEVYAPTWPVSHSDPHEKALLTSLFLKRHPQLERLSLMTRAVLIDEGFIDGTFPRLRSFRHDNKKHYVSTHRLEVIPSFILEGLEYFSPYELYGEYPVEPSRTSMCAFASRISDKHLPLIAKMFPNLERLQFLKTDENGYSGGDIRIWPMGVQDTRIKSLVKLQRLTHLAGFLLCTPFSPATPEFLELTFRELSTLPSLKYVEYQIWRFTNEDEQVEIKWISIDRDESGQYIGYKYIEPLSDMDTKSWGGFFENLSS